MKGLYKDLKSLFINLLILSAVVGWAVIECLIWLVNKIF